MSLMRSPRVMPAMRSIISSMLIHVGCQMGLLQSSARAELKKVRARNEGNITTSDDRSFE